MAERREDRAIWEYVREVKRERNVGIWKRGGKREEYWNTEEMREERGL